VDKIERTNICLFNRGTVLTDASRILPETTCQFPLAPHQGGKVDISKIIKNYVNILNQFYAIDFCLLSHGSKLLYICTFKLHVKIGIFSPSRFLLFFLSIRIKLHYKCTKCARLRWSRQGEADARDGRALCLCQCKMRKSGYPNLIQSKRRYTMKSTKRVPLLQKESSLYVVRKSHLLCHECVFPVQCKE